MTKSMKTALLAAIVVVIALLSASAAVYAESEETFANAVEIHEDEDIVLSNPEDKWQRKVYKITPEESTLYVIDVYNTHTIFQIWTKENNEYRSSDQEEELWDSGNDELQHIKQKTELIAGKDYYLIIDYHDAGHFMVHKEEVESISFTPKNPMVLEEHVDGYWYSDNDLGDLKSILNRKHFGYIIPGFKQGDKLTITYKNGDSETYKCYDDKSCGIYFRCGERFCSPMIDPYNDAFKLGKNYATIELENRYKCKVLVKVVKSTVKSFSFKFTKPLTCDKNGIKYRNGDKVIIKNSSGKRTYKWSSKHGVFIGKDKNIFESAFKVSISPLKAGSNNKITFKYGGKKYTTKIKYKK